MTNEQRAEALMAKGPIWLVRRVIELEKENAKRTDQLRYEVEKREASGGTS